MTIVHFDFFDFLLSSPRDAIPLLEAFVSAIRLHQGMILLGCFFLLGAKLLARWVFHSSTVVTVVNETSVSAYQASSRSGTGPESKILSSNSVLASLLNVRKEQFSEPATNADLLIPQPVQKAHATLATLRKFDQACASGDVIRVRAMFATYQLNPNRRKHGRPLLDRALCLGQSEEVANVLIELGADVYHTNSVGLTYLMRVCDKGYVSIPKQLLENNAQLEREDSNRDTALCHSMKAPESMFRLLLS
jgi:hypothetical protein